MSDLGYSWRNARHGSSFLMPRTENFGRWVGIAVLLGIIFHGILYFALEKIDVLVEMIVAEEKVRPAEMAMVSMPTARPLEMPDVRDVREAIEEPLKPTEELADLEDVMSEAIIAPEIDKDMLDIEFKAPALKGSQIADSFKPVVGAELDLDVPDIGLNKELLNNPIKADIQMNVGAMTSDIFDPDKFTQEMVKKGAGGKSAEGILEGFTSLEDMKKLSGNALESTKALIGSDLLFEFGKATLKSSARHSLLAVAFLIDKNDQMFCILNGHTDTFGSEEKNMKLSKDRSDAVKAWLVESAMIDPKRIVVIAHGKNKPLVPAGSKDQQAINRRVVVEMKREKPLPVIPKPVQPDLGGPNVNPVGPGDNENPEVPPAAIPQVIPRVVPVSPDQPRASNPSRPPAAVPVAPGLPAEPRQP